ncbi:hypothetical protein D3C81_1606310 [compost metagenome]
MDRQRGDHLDRGPLDQRLRALDFHQCRSPAHVQQLGKIAMPMRANLPVVQAAAFRNGLAVQEVGRRPGQLGAIEGEHGNTCCWRLHGRVFSSSFGNRLKFPKVLFYYPEVHFYVSKFAQKCRRQQRWATAAQPALSPQPGQ